jgi:hypothetical protein
MAVSDIPKPARGRNKINSTEQSKKRTKQRQSRGSAVELLVKSQEQPKTEAILSPLRGPFYSARDPKVDGAGEGNRTLGSSLGS